MLGRPYVFVWPGHTSQTTHVKSKPILLLFVVILHLKNSSIFDYSDSYWILVVKKIVKLNENKKRLFLCVYTFDYFLGFQ